MNEKKLLILFVVIGIICSLTAVSAHEGMENPIVVIDDLEPGQEVSDNVDFNVTVHEHNEVKYVNVTAEHMDTRTKYFDKQDLNPSDGWLFSWDTSNSPNGEYWITATAVDVKGLSGKSEMKLILNNTPKDSNVFLEASLTIVNKPTNIVASLKDNSSNPISDKSLEFVIDKKSYFANTTSEGVATFSFTPKEIKNYDVIVKFAGDNKYLPSQTNGTLKVMSNLTTPSITVEDIRGNNKEKIILKASLACPGLQGSNVNKTIDFYVNSKFIGSNRTDENGQAILHYIINETGGTHLYHARYQNESGDNFTDYASLYVPQSELYMTMNAVTYSSDGIFTVGNTFKLNYVVNNNGPDSAENTLLTYSIPNSLKYLQSSASKGNVTVNSNNLVWDIGDVPVGSQNLEIMFEVRSAGKISLSPAISTVTYDVSVNGTVKNRVLTVNSYQLKSKNLVKYYGGSDKYRVYLYTKDGKAVAGANIKITINKQTLNLRTNNNGFVELDVNLNPGTYPIKCTCNKLSVSDKAVIKSTLITKNIAVKKSKKTKFKAKALNSKGKAVKNKKIVFKFKGKKYTVKTNKKGIATLVLKKLKVGKYSIQTTYGKISVKNTIKIKK